MLFEMTRSAQAGLRKERQYELISNHLANANTTGFKKDILSFDQALNPILTTDYSQGSLIDTGNPLDLAIEGDGFFKLSTPSGTRYTRDGNFTVDTIGRMVTQEGFPVMGKNGPITLTGDDIFFGDQGELIMDAIAFDSLDMVTMTDLRALKKEGGNLFSLDTTKGTEIPAATARLHQGSLEGANISTIAEMTHLIDAQRMYESISKVMRTSDETDARANQMGRPA